MAQDVLKLYGDLSSKIENAKINKQVYENAFQAAEKARIQAEKAQRQANVAQIQAEEAKRHAEETKTTEQFDSLPTGTIGAVSNTVPHEMLISHLVTFNGNGQYTKTDKNKIQCPQEQTTTSESDSQVTITYKSGEQLEYLLYLYNPIQVKNNTYISKPGQLMQPDFFQRISIG